MEKIAIVVVAYNRVDSLKRLLDSLLSADYPEKVTLIISVDKSDTDQVENLADTFLWSYGEKVVVKHKENLGLRRHMLSLGKYFDEFDALIVLEDDVCVAQSFYMYAQQCVDKYASEESIAGISLYNFPLNYHNFLPFWPIKTDSDVYLMQCAQSWGEVWMRDSWRKFKEWYDLSNEEFDEKPYLPKSICNWPKSSWLKYHTRYCIEKNKFFVYPYDSLSTNNSDTGTHVAMQDTRYQVSMLRGEKNRFKLNPTVKYDGFFENMDLFEDSDVCVDLYGEKGNRCDSRYWLTTRIENYKIVTSYSLSQKPWEINVINKILGDDIFLYDTSEIVSNKFVNKGRIEQYLYQYSMGVCDELKSVIKRVKVRILRRNHNG